MTTDRNADPTSGERVRVDVADGVGTMTLSRPEHGNALDIDTSLELLDAVRRLGDDPQVRVLVLRGDGPRFCVGGDLAGFRDAPLGAGLCDDIARAINGFITIVEASPKPLVTVVHGAVGGGANGLVLASDIVIAERSTVFRLGYTGSGLTPDCGVTWYLPRTVGLARSLDLALTNRRVGADEAAAMGIVSRVVDDGGLDAELQDVLARLWLVPAETLGETKRLLRGARRSTLEAALDDEAVTIGHIGDTADAREAISAFLEKRRPTFAP